MKKFLTKQVNFAYALIIMLALTIGVGYTAAVSQPNDQVNATSPLIHQGAGEQAIANIKIGSCNGGTCIGKFDVRGALNNIALFDSTSTISPLFLVTGNVGIVGKLFVGEGAGANLPLWTTTYGTGGGGIGGPGSTFTIPLQRVNVYGNARATNLTNSSAPAPVCVNPNGMLLLCGTAPSTNGQCGPSNGGTFSTPPTTGLCNQGEASSVTTNPSTYTWTCNGINGGTTASCQANRIVTNNGVCHDFGAGPFSSQPATGQNGCDSGTYGDQTDTQYLWKWGCNGSNGGANVNCTEPRTQTYTWQIGNWGACTSSCSGTPAQGPMIDWNGNPFSWVNGKVYRSDASGSAITDCGANPQSADLVVGDHFDFDPVEFSGGACVTYLQSYPSLGYEPSIDSGLWNRISIVPGDVLDTEPGRVLAVNNDNPLYQTGQCNGTTQQSCTAVSGCNWNPGTQTRTVVCKDQNGATVSDSFCTPPKPATSQSC